MNPQLPAWQMFLRWLLIVVVACLIWWIVPHLWWQYLFFLRIPIIMSLVMVGLPLAALYVLPSMLKNMFVLKGKYQVAIAMLGSAIASGAIVVVLHNILDNASARFSIDPLLNGCPDGYYYVLAGILTLPITVTIVALTFKEVKTNGRSEEPENKVNAAIQIGVGMGLGLILDTIFLWFFIQIKNVLDYPQNSLVSQPIIFFESCLEKLTQFLLKTSSDAGYIDPKTHQLLHEHINAFVFLSILFMVYVAIFCLYMPSTKPSKEKTAAPALLYILLLVSIATLFLGNLTFFLDYSRVSVLLFWVVIAASTYFFLKVDHFFTLRDAPGQPEDSTDFSKILEQRLAHQDPDHKTLVLVCASGGGIQAAGWTTQVLMGLQKGVGESFTQAIGLISAVSGGSVGAIHYLDHFKDGIPPNSDAEQIFENATVNSLDAVGWGFAYPDLWRIVGLPFLPRLLSPIVQNQKISDRGLALETEWRGEMKTPNKTLADWRTDLSEGMIPLPVLNATAVENGARLLLSPVGFPESDEKNSFSFNYLYPNKTIDVVTAARLSASFPYVSPVCRANEDRKKNQTNYHVADGGYFDNSGFVTGLEWLQDVLESQTLNIKKVVILQINPFPEEQATTPEKEPMAPHDQNSNQTGNGFTMATLGPLKALYRVRDRVLNTRNSAEVELLKQRQWDATIQSCTEKQVNIEYIPIFFPRLPEKDHEISALFDKDGTYNPPLSWKLTQSEKNAIKKGWEMIGPKTIGLVKKAFETLS